MDGHLILISGYSQSGKSLLASWLVEVLPSVVHLEQDKYVLPQSQIPTIRDRTDWETPESIDWDSWKKSIKKELKRCKYVIAEGLFVRHDEASVQQASLILQLTVTQKLFFQRRKQDPRWGQEPEWYLEYVWESHQKNKSFEKGTANLTFHFLSQADFADIYEHIISLSF